MEGRTRGEETEKIDSRFPTLTESECFSFVYFMHWLSCKMFEERVLVKKQKVHCCHMSHGWILRKEVVLVSKLQFL